MFLFEENALSDFFETPSLHASQQKTCSKQEKVKKFVKTSGTLGTKEHSFKINDLREPKKEHYKGTLGHEKGTLPPAYFPPVLQCSKLTKKEHYQIVDFGIILWYNVHSSGSSPA